MAGFETATFASQSNAASFAVPLPTYSAGDTIFAISRPGRSDDATVSSAGWTSRHTQSTSAGVQRIYSRLMDGSEGATVTYAKIGSRGLRVVMYAVPGVTASAVLGASHGPASVPNPPNVTQAAGSLWLMGYTNRSSNNLAPAAGVSDYDDPVQAISVGSGLDFSQVSVYHKWAGLGSDDPAALAPNMGAMSNPYMASFTIGIVKPPDLGGLMLMGVG